jgi:hypothetical protein
MTRKSNFHIKKVTEALHYAQTVVIQYKMLGIFPELEPINVSNDNGQIPYRTIT